jgi:hypothetical protein
MKNYTLILTSAICLLHFSCSNNENSYVEKNAPAYADESLDYEMMESSGNAMSRSASKSMETERTDYTEIIGSAISKNIDSGKLLIKTVDMNFRVDDVYKSTLKVESLAAEMGGYVSSNNLNSNVKWVELTPISKDSSLETTTFSVNNYLTIRVPNNKLDATLKSLAKEIEFLDSRSIRAEDVSLQIKANQMIIENAAKFEQKLNEILKNRGGKVEDAIRAEELIQRKKEESDRAIIANVHLMDRIEFSTINVNIYQRDKIERTVLPNIENIDAYRPNIFKRIADSIKTGWNGLVDAIAFIVQHWGLIVALVFVYIIIKWYRRKNKAA